MSKHGAVILSNIRQLLRRSNVRQFECCGLRLAPVTTTLATLHFWPGHEQQQHRTFSSSTHSDDDKEKLRKNLEKQEKPSPTAVWMQRAEEIRQKKLIKATTKKDDGETDDHSKNSTAYQIEAMTLANRMNAFRAKQRVKDEEINISKELKKSKFRIQQIKDRLVQSKKKYAVLEEQETKENVAEKVEKDEKQEVKKGVKTLSAKELIKRKQERHKKSLGLDPLNVKRYSNVKKVMKNPKRVFVKEDMKLPQVNKQKQLKMRIKRIKNSRRSDKSQVIER
ncbi:uncharacterized protein MCU isoform X5 [Drosophila virilis]|uniref:uncharacterized protein MCU isoform X5 n=1 Tax=Drosophila virilis TaxID=7244 RepID=UPI0013963641|nr:nucleoporin GLE1 isoform X5 [Drosophila virilis]